jgi:hypothetical protein
VRNALRIYAACSVYLCYSFIGYNGLLRAARHAATAAVDKHWLCLQGQARKIRVKLPNLGLPEIRLYQLNCPP